MNINHREILAEIIDFFGNQASMARLLGVSRKSVCVWQGKGIPPGRVGDIQRLSGHHFKPHMIRPDLFPEPIPGQLLKKKRKTRKPKVPT